MQLDEIISHCQLGDIETFEELYKQYYKKAYGTAYIISGQKDIAEDIAQEAFIVCYKSIKNIRDPQTFNTWFYRIVVRISWRMTKKHKNTCCESFIGDLNSSESAINTNDTLIEAVSSKILIRQKIQTLKLPLKTVLILYYYNDMSIKEISKVLDCFEGTVKSRLFKARKILQNELTPYYVNTFEKLGLNRKEVNI